MNVVYLLIQGWTRWRAPLNLDDTNGELWPVIDH